MNIKFIVDRFGGWLNFWKFIHEASKVMIATLEKVSNTDINGDGKIGSN